MPRAWAREPSGFQGAVGSLPLADLLQVWSLNRFSGLVTVHSEGRRGRLYFSDGEIVHAEAEGLAGEPAVRVIVGWPEGLFDLAPNTSTLKRTIRKSVSHLLLEAHSHLDEGRRLGPQPVPPRPAPVPQPREPARVGVLDQIRAINGVKQIVRFGSNGRVVGGGGPEADVLAAHGLYLALVHAAAARAAFGFRELTLAALENHGQPMVLVRHSAGFLCVAVEQGVPLDSVVAQLRSLLMRTAMRTAAR